MRPPIRGVVARMAVLEAPIVPEEKRTQFRSILVASDDFARDFATGIRSGPANVGTSTRDREKRTQFRPILVSTTDPI